ncbi:MAG: hypothetical protein LQ339_003790 [Xanthoria mediterranea]|nr:MAG: hypothetical protein LQ339_003790 [Xanthoria mediterranea]
MDPTQQKALNALESFILLSSSASSPRAAADLVKQATSAPNTYVFAELLQTKNIAALKDGPPEYASFYTLLEIFAWGTWADYSSTPDLPPLTDAQAHKLRQLSLLSLATSPSTLTYTHLLTALSLSSTRALEDLVISTIYAGLLVAKLDTKSQRVDVSSVSPLRDLPPARVPQLLSTLDTWNGRCVSVLDDLETQIKEVRQKALERRKREQRDETAVEKLVGQALKERGKAGEKRMAQDPVGGSEAAVGDGDDGMDLDEKAGPGRPRGAKRGGGAFKNAAKRMMG